MHLATIVAAALLSAASAAAVAPAGGSVRYADLTKDFARIYDRDAALPEKERIQRFQADFATLIPGFYSADRLKTSSAEYDHRIADALASYPDRRVAIARVSEQFSTLLDAALVTFERQLGAFPRGQAVYLLHSLGEMDGGTRDLGHGNVLIFGADVIARVHGDDDLTPFFHHELFHVYRDRQMHEACDLLWCALWDEGLAVYAAQRLNPKATDSELLLTTPEPIRSLVEAHKDEAICTAIRKLDSRSEADVAALFGSGRLGPNLPPRFGYYVGYLVARDLGRTRSLRQLARLQGQALRNLVGRSLERMADCPSE